MKTKAHTASIQDILGTKPAPPAAVPLKCFACTVPLTSARVEALKQLNTPFDNWACVRCASLITAPKLGIFMGEVGTSELRIVDKIYTDSVRDIFMEPESTQTEE